MDATDIPEPDDEGSEDHIPKHALDISADELRTLQATDTTLDAIREAAGGNRSSAGVGFFKKDGLLYRKWTPPGWTGGGAACSSTAVQGYNTYLSTQHTSVRSLRKRQNCPSCPPAILLAHTIQRRCNLL